MEQGWVCLGRQIVQCNEWKVNRLGGEWAFYLPNVLSLVSLLLVVIWRNKHPKKYLFVSEGAKAWFEEHLGIPALIWLFSHFLLVAVGAYLDGDLLLVGLTIIMPLLVIVYFVSKFVLKT